MYQNKSIYKRISLVLGITTLLLGLLPVPVLGRVGMVNADDGGVVEPPVAEKPAAIESPAAEEPPADEPLVEEPPTEEPLVEEPPVEEPLAEIPDPLEPPAEQTLADEPLVEEPPVEDPLLSEEELLDQGEFAPMLMMAIGDDPDVENEIPVPGNYNNGLCNSNPLYCVDEDPVTNPNDYTDEGSFGSKTYDIPEINGILAEIVVVKSGDDYFFFKNGSSATCVADKFCVEFDGTKVHIYSYESQGKGYKGYNLINFWVTGLPEGSIPGCTDRSANNFDPEANLDDGSCDYDEPGGGGGPGDPGDPGDNSISGGAGGLPLLIPVTGADLDGGFSLYRIMTLLSGTLLLTSGLIMKGTVKKEKKSKA